MNWRRIEDERLFMQSPIGLRLRDELTTKEPLGTITAALEIKDGFGQFRATDIEAVLTPSSVLIYPGLGRSHVTSGGPRRYRVTLQPELYFPDYLNTPNLGTKLGIEFNAYPYNDVTPPAQPPVFADAWLVPNNAYPYSASYPVIRGLVVDAQQKRIAGAVVTFQVNKERTFTDERGMFSLPLRTVKKNATIDARDDVTGKVGAQTVDVTNPFQRDANLTIQIQ